MSIKVIPAIDIIDGQCVRLTKGDYNVKKIYSSDPLEVAKSFEEAGLEMLHLVDLDGAKSKHIINHAVLDRIANHTSLKVDFGGGIKTREDANIAFECGAAQINCGSLAVQNPEVFIEWIQEFGPERVILSADSRDGKIASQGWLEDSGKDLIEFIQYFEKNSLKYLTCTDINTDGMLTGPNVALYIELKRTFPNLVITASGGVSSIEDIKELNNEQIDQVIVGKAIYEGRIKLGELINF